jgi:membrane associated rhomboid family serine protease
VAPHVPHTINGPSRASQTRLTTLYWRGPMLPVQDVSPSRRSPYAVVTLIVALATSTIVLRLGVTDDVVMLASQWSFVPERPQLWAPFSTLALVAGLPAVLAHGAALWIFGDNVEDRLGAFRLLALSVLGAVTLPAASLLMPDAFGRLTGPGGVIGAVVGAHLSLFPRMRILVIVPTGRCLDAAEVPSGIIAAIWLLLQGFRWPGTPAIGDLFWSPLAGLAVGAIAVHALKRRDRMHADWWCPTG